MERLKIKTAVPVREIGKPQEYAPATLELVRAVIFNDRAEVLLLQRGPNQKLDQYKWELPGGKIDPDEDPLEALKREIYEETGLNVQVPDQLPMEDQRIMSGGKYDSVEAETKTWVCLADTSTIDFDIQEKPEHVRAYWCTKQELQELFESGDISVTTKQTIENFLLQ